MNPDGLEREQHLLQPVTVPNTEARTEGLLAKITRLSTLPPARKIEGAEIQSWTNADRLVYMFTRIDRKGDRELVTKFAAHGKFDGLAATVLLDELLILELVEFRPLMTHAWDQHTGKRYMEKGAPALFLTKAGKEHAFKLGFVYHGSLQYERTDLSAARRVSSSLVNSERAHWRVVQTSSQMRWRAIETNVHIYTQTKKGVVISLKNPRSNPQAVRELNREAARGNL